MLISPDELLKYWDLCPSVIVHIGGHEAEELPDYLRLGWGSKTTIWVEALPEKAEVIRAKTANIPGHQVFCFVAWNTSGEKLMFHEANNGQSSSALPLAGHASIYPDVFYTNSTERTTQRLCDVPELVSLGRIGLVNLDIQGAELRALEGLGHLIDKVEAVYSEVNLTALYSGCNLLSDLDVWLQTRGFERVDWVLLPEGWGDALWLRASHLPLDYERRYLRRRAATRRAIRMARIKGMSNRIRKRLLKP